MESRFFKIRCDNCGAEYRINSRGEMNCAYCGSVIYLNDKDYEEYLNAREEMLVKDKVGNDLINTEGDVLGKWVNERTISFEEAYTGNTITCTFCYRYSNGRNEIFVGRKRVIRIISSGSDYNSVERISYPSADIKGLRKYLPNIGYETQITGGRKLLAIDKDENVYPLALFSALDAKQVAWMISRFENLGCLFEYNGIDLPGTDITDFYINPKTHELYMLGGWDNVIPMGRTNHYLRNIRRIALEIMNTASAPKMCIDFLNSPPAADAYTDFEDWDNVIEKGFSGHHFHKFTP